MPLLLGWTGMRGVVSFAAALAIPLTLADGTAFPYRSLILFITFVVILLTLVGQGLTLPVLIRRSGLFPEVAPADPLDTAERRIRNGLSAHTLAYLKERAKEGIPERDGLRELLQRWEARAATAPVEPKDEQMRQWALELFEDQRQYLMEVNRDPEVDEELIRRQIYLIDLEEERLRMKF